MVAVANAAMCTRDFTLADIVKADPQSAIVPTGIGQDQTSVARV